ncbi:hypothetical protein L1887_03183 [Cichorium endivia]|nr:hypothetical protein L1887_03183 [Cichorium endivia]
MDYFPRPKLLVYNPSCNVVTDGKRTVGKKDVGKSYNISKMLHTSMFHDQDILYHRQEFLEKTGRDSDVVIADESETLVMTDSDFMTELRYQDMNDYARSEKTRRMRLKKKCNSGRNPT